jgi:hypothetical protein
MDLNPLSAIFDIGSKVIDRIWPDPATRDAAKLELFKAQQAGDLADAAQVFELAKAQISVNAVEAASTSLFVSGWRPFIGWICGFALAYKFIFAPLLSYAFAVFGHPVDMPVLDFTEMLTVLMGMLGLGSLRTLEKIKGVANT